MSLNQIYPAAWYAFMNAMAGQGQKTQQLKFSIFNQLVPPHITNVTLTGIIFKLDVPDGTRISGSFMSLQIGGTAMPPITFTNNYASLSVSPPIGQFAGDWVMSFDLTQVPTTLTKGGFLDPDIFLNLETILSYEGNIVWD